jgi:hypothetical protein
LRAWNEAYRDHFQADDEITDQLYHLPRTFTICEVPKAGKN